MLPILYGHPFSSYTQKALIALYENATPFEFRSLDPAFPDNQASFAALWPIGKFPVMVDGGRTVAEASIIIEHLDLAHPGPVRFIPADAREALDVRFMDRFLDLYVHVPMQKFTFDALRAPGERDPRGVADARRMLDIAYAWLDARLAGREWACNDAFGLADCSAAPALFYADWVHPIPAAMAALRAYRARLNARPSYRCAIEEARPFRPYFPLGAPDRD